jgi:hypothetical protein
VQLELPLPLLLKPLELETIGCKDSELLLLLKLLLRLEPRELRIDPPPPPLLQLHKV